MFESLVKRISKFRPYFKRVRAMTFGGFVAKTLGLLLLLVAAAILESVRRILFRTLTPADVSNLQKLVSEVLLPTFQTFGTVIIGAGIFKGALTLFNNPNLPDDKKEEISFLRW
jgi:hypothetical protein